MWYQFAAMLFTIHVSMRCTKAFVSKLSHQWAIPRKSFGLFSADTNEQEKPPNQSKKFVPYPFNFHEELELTILDVTNLGAGVGRWKLPSGDEWVVMVPFTLPSERVLCRVYRNYGSYSEADLVKVIDSSPDRIVPHCKYYGTCGGCQYQHVAVSIQREWKKKQVEDVMTRIGGFSDLSINDAVGTNEYYGYRSKISPHYDAPRLNQPLKIGFQQRGTRRIVDIDSCPIATPAINIKYAQMRDSIAQALQEKPTKKGATLLLREHADGVETKGRNFILQRVGEIDFMYRAGEFFQTNPFVLPLMVEHVTKRAVGHDCDHLIDAYCGSGLFSLSCAKAFSQVYGVEVSELAVEAAKANAARNNITNCQFVCGVSEAIFSKVSHFPRDQTAVILDPPRKGCDDVFLRQLFDFRPKKIVYVSCDPATQARDAQAICAAGYNITDITPFDLFPQTRHIENVMVFLR